MKPTRARKFFLEINQGAKCYAKTQSEMVKFAMATNPEFFAIILHDKDTTETGEVKPSHYHVLITYKSARSEQAIRSAFDGAHEEQAYSMGDCSKYLLHITPKSMAEGKHQYKPDEVATNNRAYYTDLVNQMDLEEFDPNRIVEYYHEGTIGILAYYMRFGSAIKGWTTLIAQVERALMMSEDKKNEQDRIDGLNKPLWLEEPKNPHDI